MERPSPAENLPRHFQAAVADAPVSLKCSTIRDVPAVSEATGLPAARRVLRDVFGFSEFRAGQAETIAATLEGRDVLAVMPTGAGKSLCYQVPALVRSGGITVVVSPLLALMKDQVDALRSAGVEAAAVNSTISRDEQGRVLHEAASGRLRLLYVAPERFGDGAFMAAMRSVPVALLAVDEAHCISQWGHDFRPAYRELSSVRDRLGDPPLIALTATADPRVRADIVERLALRDPVVHVSGFDRPNLRFAVVRVRSQKEKADLIAARLKEHPGESAIIYCATRRRVEDLTDSLQRQRVRCARYHAGMEDADRKRIQEAFARDSLRVIIATNAFGMGIDKPDVRLVIHHDMPGGIEQYYQEAGRGGRDGDPAECILYYSPRDRGTQEFFIETSNPEPQRVLEVYRQIALANGGKVFVPDLVPVEDEQVPVNAAITALVESGLVVRRGYQVWDVAQGAEERIDLGSIEEHRRHSFAKLDAMQAYAESMTCLRRRLLGYFGEDAPAACGNCSPCLSPAVRTVPAEEDGLFQELRLIRRRLAEEGDVPPYVIFPDSTLRAMAQQRPGTRIEMLRIPGVGVTKMDRYGGEFLAAIRAAREAGGAAGSGGEASNRQPDADQRPARAAKAPNVSSTAARTWELSRTGMSLEGIAAQRGLTTGVIASHIAELIEAGAVTDPTPWVDEVTVGRLRAAVGGGPVGALGPIRQRLPDVSLERLTIARAWLNRKPAGDR